MAASQPIQAGLFAEIPVDIPPIVVRIWQAAITYYTDKRHFEPPTRKQLSEILIKIDPDKAGSESTIDRARRDHPDLVPWPIRRGMFPPWKAAVVVDETPVEPDLEIIARDMHTGQEQRIPVRSDEQGHLFIVRGSTTLAASLGTFLILDSMDGKLDGVVHWCAAFARLAHMLA